MVHHTTIDWNDAWKRQQREHERCGTRDRQSNIWETIDAARMFARMWKNDTGGRIRKTIEDLPLTPNSRVLDIGSGPGTIAFPISKLVAHVTAVEPSEGMCTVFSEMIREEGCNTIRLVRKRWEDVDIQEDLEPPYEVVFASYSLNVPDLRDAIEKMQEASSKYIAIYWFTGESTWDAMSRDLWPQLHGSDFVPAPTCDLIYNLLYSMGIYPNIEVFPLEHNNSFDSLDDAVTHFSGRVFADTDKQKACVRSYLRERVRHHNDQIIIPGHSVRVRIWWEKGDPGA